MQKLYDVWTKMLIERASTRAPARTVGKNVNCMASDIRFRFFGVEGGLTRAFFG
jgi:hypothetical protein